MAKSVIVAKTAQESQRGQYLLNLSNEEVFDRYVVPAGKTTFQNDFNEVLITPKDPNNPRNGENKYTLTGSIRAGGMLTAIFTDLNMFYNGLLGEKGYKLNASAIIPDMEDMLRANQSAVISAVSNQDMNDYIYSLQDTLYAVCGKILTYINEKTETINY